MLAVAVLAAMSATGYEVPAWAWVLTVPVAIVQFLSREPTIAFWRGLMGH